MKQVFTPVHETTWLWRKLHPKFSCVSVRVQTCCAGLPPRLPIKEIPGEPVFQSAASDGHRHTPRDHNLDTVCLISRFSCQRHTPLGHTHSNISSNLGRAHSNQTTWGACIEINQTTWSSPSPICQATWGAPSPIYQTSWGAPILICQAIWGAHTFLPIKQYAQNLE